MIRLMPGLLREAWQIRSAQAVPFSLAWVIYVLRNLFGRISRPQLYYYLQSTGTAGSWRPTDLVGWGCFHHWGAAAGSLSNSWGQAGGGPPSPGAVCPQWDAGQGCLTFCYGTNSGSNAGHGRCHTSQVPGAATPLRYFSPANDISYDDVVKAVRSFPRGVAPGPTGMRPDFLKQIVDIEDEQYGALAGVNLSHWYWYQNIFYYIVIPSATGGQQGCPLMTACHVVVKRW